jgi:aspartyl-tRNA(Asn)/glutamyl-tRNA(Gln) amidotransferase subunit B
MGAASYYDDVLQAAARECLYSFRPEDCSFVKKHVGCEPVEAFPEHLQELCKSASNWVSSELFGRLKATNKELTNCGVSASYFGELVGLVQTGYVSGRMAKETLSLMLSGDQRRPRIIIDEMDWAQVNDESALKVLCAAILADPRHKALLDKYKGGHDRSFAAIVAKVLEASEHRANPQLLSSIIKSMIHASPK